MSNGLSDMVYRVGRGDQRAEWVKVCVTSELCDQVLRAEQTLVGEGPSMDIEHCIEEMSQ